MFDPLLELRPQGLYCPAGDFHIDPVLPVPRAVVTHAHGDHARWGSDRYLSSREGAAVLDADALTLLADTPDPAAATSSRHSPCSLQ